MGTASSHCGCHSFIGPFLELRVHLCWVPVGPKPKWLSWVKCFKACVIVWYCGWKQKGLCWVLLDSKHWRASNPLLWTLSWESVVTLSCMFCRLRNVKLILSFLSICARFVLVFCRSATWIYVECCVTRATQKSCECVSKMSQALLKHISAISFWSEIWTKTFARSGKIVSVVPWRNNIVPWRSCVALWARQHRRFGGKHSPPFPNVGRLKLIFLLNLNAQRQCEALNCNEIVSNSISDAAKARFNYLTS